MTTTVGTGDTLPLSIPSVSRRMLIGLLTVGVTCAQTPARVSKAHSGRLAAWAGVPHARAPQAGFSKSHHDPSYRRLPLSFERNVGQTDPRVDFLSRGRAYVAFLTGAEAVLALRGGAPDDEGGAGATSVVRVQFAGTAGAAKAIGSNELPGKANYFIGNDPRRWHTNIPTYATVAYADVYPGIDLVYHSRQQTLEYDFIVRPGADARRIAMIFDGAGEMGIDARGDLVIQTGSGTLRQRRPVVYQEIDDQPRAIASAYIRRGVREIAFEIGAYDTSRPLVIDPPAIVYSTYLGGTGDDGVGHVAVDGAGNVFLVASAMSVDFPTTTDAFQPRHNGGGDKLGRRFEVCVTKLNAAGSALLHSTYLGGSHGADFATGLAIDVDGRAYVSGSTFSDDFPTTLGALDRTFDGSGTNGFVTRLNETGSALIYSTYLGASGAVNDIAVDAAGSAFVTGTTGPDFPTTPNAFDSGYNGGTDAFVTKLDASGSALIYSTYLGGSSGADVGNAIAIDDEGNTYVTGSTTSADFPTTPNAFDTVGGKPRTLQQYDAFVTKLDATGSALVYSTYLSGGDVEFSFDIAVDAGDTAYVTGRTDSADFPTTPGAFDTVARSNSSVFVTRLDASGSRLVYSTRLGATFGPASIAVEPRGIAWVAGRTFSPDFPTTRDAFDTTIGPGHAYPDSDAFITGLNAAGTALIFSTYLGPGEQEIGTGIAIDPNGSLYVSGYTFSNDFPTTAGAFDTTFNGPYRTSDGFVAKISLADTTPPSAMLSASTHVLWPPNGRMRAVQISGTLTDEASGVDPHTAVFRVVDEYGQVQPNGPITVAADGRYSFRVLLEASRRHPDPDGRRYDVLVTVADRAGNLGSASVVISVPHDQRAR
jgi:hypothetical protein